MTLLRTIFLIFLSALALLSLHCQTDRHAFENPLDPNGTAFKGYSAPVLQTNASSGAPPNAEYSVYWNDVGASAYIIEEAENSSFSGAVSFSVTTLSKAFSHSAEGKTYYYRVKTNTGNKDSGWSGVVSVEIKSGVTVIGVQMVAISGGTFQMGNVENSSFGSSNEKPVHSVTVSGFEMSIFEITQGQFQSVMGSNPSYYKSGDNYPVEQVSWYDAVKFCNKLSDAAGRARCYNESMWACDLSKNGFRLPTEVEWEYACRAGTATLFYTGSVISSNGYTSTDLDRAGWYDGNSGTKTHPVGEKVPNAWGLYDMHGNVWEWCNDWYGESYYSSSPTADPPGPSNGSYRVLRGGCWISFAWYCRSAHRGWNFPSYTINSLGFRVVRRP